MLPLDTRDLILLTPDKRDPERDAVAQRWKNAGGEVVRLGRFWDPPTLPTGQVRVYGNDTFCLVLAEKLGLRLVSPPDELLLGLDPSLTGRPLRGLALTDAGDIAFPAFVKSAVPKLFRAGVYDDHATLLAEVDGLESETLLIVSGIVAFVCEVRCWILGGEVRTLACYEGACDLAAARRFASIVARAPGVPEVCVIDVGQIGGADGPWAVVEANAAWGSGLNGCDPAEAARCVARAVAG